MPSKSCSECRYYPADPARPIIVAGPCHSLECSLFAEPEHPKCGLTKEELRYLSDEKIAEMEELFVEERRLRTLATSNELLKGAAQAPPSDTLKSAVAAEREAPHAGEAVLADGGTLRGPEVEKFYPSIMVPFNQDMVGAGETADISTAEICCDVRARRFVVSEACAAQFEMVEQDDRKPSLFYAKGEKATVRVKNISAGPLMFIACLDCDDMTPCSGSAYAKPISNVPPGTGLYSDPPNSSSSARSEPPHAVPPVRREDISSSSSSPNTTAQPSRNWTAEEVAREVAPWPDNKKEE